MLDFNTLALAIQRFTDNVKTFLSTASMVYVGEYKGWAPETIPAGWLLCDGSAVSRTEYADLFAEIGVAFGPGDGSTTFNLPDFRGRVPRGLGVGEEIGQIGGHDSITLLDSQLPTHAHAFGPSGSATTVMKMAATGTDFQDTPSETNNIIGAELAAGAEFYHRTSSLENGEVEYGAITTSLNGGTETIGNGDLIDITPSYVGMRWIIAAVGVRATAVA